MFLNHSPECAHKNTDNGLCAVAFLGKVQSYSATKKARLSAEESGRFA